MDTRPSYISNSASSRREQFFTSSATANNPSALAHVPPQPTKSIVTPMNFVEKQANGVFREMNGDANFNNHRSISPVISTVSHASSINSTSTPVANVINNISASTISATKETVKVHGGVTIKEMHGYVGFANIPNQVYRQAIKRGFEFSLMVVGQSGLGKSTFVNTLFLSDFASAKSNIAAHNNKKTSGTSAKTIQIEETAVRLVENGVTLNLTLVDTPGFGDAVDNSNCWDAVIQFVDRKNMDYFNEEAKVNRKEDIPDRRVHCCLYFIAPTGHGLKPLDIEFMKRLHERVNIIPVIAKADTMTPEELSNFKQKIIKEIDEHRIRIYDFPDGDEENDSNKEHRRQKQRVPFAVIGSNMVAEIGGRKIRCRKYPWGVVEVENLEHNDFVALRNMIIRTHMIDLVDVTRCVHYENFRCNQLTIGDVVDSSYKHPFTTMEEQKREHELTLKNKSEDMEKVLEEKVHGKLMNLNKIREELDTKQKNHEKLLDEERKKLSGMKESLEQDKQVFRQQFPDFHKYTSSESLKKDKKKKSVF